MKANGNTFMPKIIAAQQDDGSWAAYDDSRYDESSPDLTIGRGSTREEALADLVEAYEWTDAGCSFVSRVVFALANLSAVTAGNLLSDEKLRAIARVAHAAREHGHDVLGIDDAVMLVDELISLRSRVRSEEAER